MLHKNALSFDDANHINSSELFPRKILATLRYFSENHALIFFLSILLIASYSIITPFLVDEGCLSKYDEASSSIKLFNKYGFSSKFMRSLENTSCRGSLSQEPCHVYVTSSEPDPSTNIIINFQLATDTCGHLDCKPVIRYGANNKNGTTFNHESEAMPFINDYFESKGEINS